MAKAKEKSVWFCSECGADSPRWEGRCPSCGAWNTMVEEKVKATASEVYDLMTMKGIVRIDFIVKKDGTPFVLEVNTTPGQTATSFIPQQIRAAGMKEKDVFSDVMESILNS